MAGGGLGDTDPRPGRMRRRGGRFAVLPPRRRVRVDPQSSRRRWHPLNWHPPPCAAGPVRRRGRAGLEPAADAGVPSGPLCQWLGVDPNRLLSMSARLGVGLRGVRGPGSGGGGRDFAAGQRSTYFLRA